MSNKRIWQHLTAFLSIGLFACGARTAIEGDIVNAAVSPDPAISALTTRYGGNSTVAWVYRVYLQSSGAEAQELVRADKVQDMHVSWRDRGTVVVSMKCGRIFSFQNFYDVLDEDGKLKERIAVTLVTGGLCSESVLGNDAQHRIRIEKLYGTP